MSGNDYDGPRQVAHRASPTRGRVMNHHGTIADRLGEEMDQDTRKLVNTRPAKDFPNIPTTLLQAILVDQDEPDHALALEKANRSLAAYVRAHPGWDGRWKFLSHAKTFLRHNFKRMYAFNFNLHAFVRLKDVAAAMGAAREFSLAWAYAESEGKEPKVGD